MVAFDGDLNLQNAVSTGTFPSLNVLGKTLWGDPTSSPNPPAVAFNPSFQCNSPPPTLFPPRTITHCHWSTCTTTIPTSSLLTHWKTTHLPPINALAKLQPGPQRQSFCLWKSCHKEFKRSTDLDRHVQSIHLGINSHCRVPGCDNNGGKGFSRHDKLRAHGRKAHGSQ